ncbi:MAG TPA: hypothetical protein VI912_03190 [Candidatus Bilamarchaeaceae archaeon]|nr:hypothetical protein [Candidatus Bilamarchaeaceae archaeon]
MSQQLLQRKLQITQAEFRALKERCFRSVGGVFRPKQGLPPQVASFHDAFALDVPDQSRSRVIFGQWEAKSEEPHIFAFLKLNPNPQFGSQFSPFDYALLMLVTQAFTEKDISIESSFAGLYLLPVPDFDALSTRLLAVHNAFSLASWSEGPTAQGPLHFGCRRLFELARFGPIDLRSFETDPQLVEAIRVLRNLPAITDILEFVANRPQEA